MKVVGIVTETLVVQKEVEIEVPDDADDGEIHQAVRDKSYEHTILDCKTHGWDGVDTLDVEVTWTKYGECPGCKQERPLDDGKCPNCGLNFPSCSS
jgi:hypothetical protein